MRRLARAALLGLFVGACSEAGDAGAPDRAAAADAAAPADMAPGDGAPEGLSLRALSPARGPSGGGVAVTLAGTGFAAGMTVRFGGVAAQGVTVLSPTQATVVLPPQPGARGAVAVELQSAGGPLVRVADAFLYYAEQIDFDTDAYEGWAGALYDVNGDGRLDLVTDDRLGGAVVVRLGLGDGSFSISQSYFVGGEVGLSSVQDLSGDGKADLLVSVYSVYGIEVKLLAGRGDGTFLPPQTVIPFSPSFEVRVADINGDGKPDLLLLGEEVTLHLGKGDGSVQPGVPVSSVTPNRDLQLADVSGDGKPDLIFSGVDYVSVSVNVGDGTFQAAESAPLGGEYIFPPPDLQDVDGDGKLDLVVAYLPVNNVQRWGVLLGKGDGTFLPARPLEIAGSRIDSTTFADVNGDGRPDLIAVTNNQSAVALCLGKGDGTFLAATALSPPDQRTLVTVAVADVNRDGKLDIGIGSGDRVRVLLGKGDGTFLATPDVQSGAVSSLAFLDAIGDGTLDLIIEPDYRHLRVVPGQGDGTFRVAHAPLPTGAGPVVLVAQDLNRDGKPDLITVNNQGSSVSILRNRGDGSFLPALSLATDPGPTALAVGDLNGDGAADLVVGYPSERQVSVLSGKGDGTFLSARSQPVEDETSQVQVHDMNGDGKLDLILVSSVMLGRGDGTFLPPQGFMDVFRDETSIIADMNRDGRPDLISIVPVPGRDPGFVQVRLGKGDGTLQRARTFSGGYGSSLAVWDLNGDGALDVLAGPSMYFGDDEGGLQRPFIIGDRSGDKVMLGDVDGDGRQDAISLSFYGVTVLRGKGDGTFLPAQSFYPGDGAEALAVADVDGDGRLDVLTASPGFAQVNVLRNLSQ